MFSHYGPGEGVMESYLWPVKGGTRQERFMVAVMILELLLIGAGFYALSWKLIIL
jgi:hypothetical protein